MNQLPLDLGFPPRYGAGDFMVAPANAAAHGTLSRWPDWPSRHLILVGPEGSGKSHLATIWAARANARRVDGAELAGLDPRQLAETATVIDDADRLGAGEAVLFHALNLAREAGTDLLLTARTPPDLWGLRTRDLLSRLRLAPLLCLTAPGDDLLRAVMVKLFLDRQLMVETAVIDYLMLRTDRSLGAIRRLVDDLDRVSLVDQRRITRAIAARVLQDTSPA